MSILNPIFILSLFSVLTISSIDSTSENLKEKQQTNSIENTQFTGGDEEIDNGTGKGD